MATLGQQSLFSLRPFFFFYFFTLVPAVIQWFSDVLSHTECLLGWYHFCWRTALNSPSWCHWICKMPHANRLPAPVLSESLMAKSTVAMTHLPAGRAAESLPAPFWLLGPASPKPFPAHHDLLIEQLSFLCPFPVALMFFCFVFFFWSS